MFRSACDKLPQETAPVGSDPADEPDERPILEAVD